MDEDAVFQDARSNCPAGFPTMTSETTNRLPSEPQALRQHVLGAFKEIFGRAPRVMVRSPGRVSLLGGHVDYSEGWVLPAAIDRAVFLAAAPVPQRTLTVHALNLGESVTLDLDALPSPLPERRGDTAWHDYPAGMAWALGALGHRLPGLDVVFAGNLPMASGVSSSAAVLMAFLSAFEGLLEPATALLLGGSRAPSGPFRLDGKDRARLGERVENAYLGLQSGVMDHFAVLHGRPGRAVFLDCRHLTFERVPVPDHLMVLVADSGIRRRLADSDFNDRRGECQQAVAALQPYVAGLQTLRDLSLNDFEFHSHHLTRKLRRRAQHAVEECRRVRLGAAALDEGDLETFSALMRRSHISSRDLYEVSLPEIDVLAAAAWQSAGCWGARLSGGGFGGCVVGLVEKDAADSVIERLQSQFEADFGRRPECFTCELAAGIKVEMLPG